MCKKKIKTQVLILGSGPGGYSAAFRCSDLGMQTILVERYHNLGGVCLNAGCIPSKTLLHITGLIKINKNLKKYGIYSENTHFDINKINSWKNKIVTQLSNNLSKMAKTRKITVINGFGTFTNEKTLLIHNNITHLEIEFDYAIIATGSHSILLPSIPDDQRIWNATDALSLTSIPNHLLIIGSGAVGLEMATIYSILGSKIDIIEIHNQIIPSLDADVSYRFTQIIKKDFNLFINTKIKSIYTKKEGVYVTMENNADSTIQYNNCYDAILIAIGRTPNSTELNLENIGININKHGFINVNAQMRTNIPHIFAIGDVVGHPMLAHKSIHEGHIAAEVIAGKKHFFDVKVIPSIIYTTPEIAWVGYTEKELQNKHIDYETVTFPWIASGKAIASDCAEGMTKLIFNKKTQKIIGGTIIGSHASEILGEISLAIEMGCDVEDITLTIHAHPTLYESIKSAASIYTGSITELLNVKTEKLRI